MLRSLYWRVNFFFKNLKSKRMKRRFIEKDSTLTLETKNGTLVVDAADLEVGGKLRTKGEYGIEEINRICKYITDKSSVFNSGGTYRIISHSNCEKCSKLVAIEANPRNFNLLQKNIELN